MNIMVKCYYKPRTVPKHKIYLKNKSIKKIWVKKSNLNCCVASTSLKVVSTDSWYFCRSCSRHMIAKRNFFKGVFEENEITRLTKKTKPQEQSDNVTPDIAT